MAKELTNAELKSLTCPADKSNIEVNDGKVSGLRVRIGKKSKVFTLMYRLRGRKKRITLGEYPELSLSDARIIAIEYLSLIGKGIDPVAYKKEEVKKQAAQMGISLAPTIPEIKLEFQKYHLPHLRPVTRKNYLHRLEAVIIPYFKDRPIDTLTKRDLINFVEYLSIDKGSPGEAMHSFAVLSSLLTFAYDRDYLQNKPELPKKVKSQLKAKVKPRTKTYEDEVIVKHWAYFEQLTRPTTKVYFKLLYYLGLRSGELRRCKWTYIDWDKQTLVLPGSITKNKEDHVVPMTKTVVALFESLKAVTGKKEYVFSDEFENRPFTMNTPVQSARKKLGHFAPHDVRRTVRTKWAEIGISRDLSERMLNHKVDVLIETYDRHDYYKEKKAAYQKWEKALHRLLEITY